MKSITVTQSAVQKCAQLLERANSVGVLTGAGISTSAGIPDFRGPQGLYVTRRYDPDTIFDINYFYANPAPFYEFAHDFIGLEATIEPTFAHRFLAHLEMIGKIKGIVTQNIDSLHQMAGSQNVLEMHGSFWRSFCLVCAQEYSFEIMKHKLAQENVVHCPCGGVIKPDIVFFGENVKFMDEAIHLAEKTDLFLVIGTSCVVYPAALVPTYASGDIVIINKSLVDLPRGNVVLQAQEDIDEFFKNIAALLQVKISDN